MTKYVIKKSDIVHNYGVLASKTHSLIIPMLKADCYGLGAKAVMELLHSECGVNLVAVSRLEEAFSLNTGSCDLLLTSCYHDIDSIKKIVDGNIICAVDSLGQARRIGDYAKQFGKNARIHIKINTGFGRFGFAHTNLFEIKEVFAVEGITVCGIFSHFSSAFSSAAVTDRQFELFKGVVKALKDSGFDTGIAHIANSSATVRSDKYHLDAIRVGSLLLGRLPMAHNLDLRKVGSFETEIAAIHHLKKGENIGYGNVFKLKKDTRVAVLCVGSADGVLIKKDYDTYRIFDILRYGFGVFKMLLRDNRMTVYVNGKPAKTVGRVALTHTMIDVTGLDCKCGDKVTINISPLYVADKVEREYI